MKIVFHDGSYLEIGEHTHVETDDRHIPDLDVFPIMPQPGRLVRVQGEIYLGHPFGWERLDRRVPDVETGSMSTMGN